MVMVMKTDSLSVINHKKMFTFGKLKEPNLNNPKS